MIVPTQQGRISSTNPKQPGLFKVKVHLNLQGSPPPTPPCFGIPFGHCHGEIPGLQDISFTGALIQTFETLGKKFCGLQGCPDHMGIMGIPPWGGSSETHHRLKK